VLTTDQKGAIAEAAIALAAIELGIGVSRPLGDERYDLVFDLGTRFLRVQCKWASREGEIVLVRSYSCRRTRDGLLRRPYSTDEIDAVAAYCAELDRCYLLPGQTLWRPGRHTPAPRTNAEQPEARRQLG
jgi:PD-(D/E)XK endonuclease